jgi:hypothetical protein
VIEIVAESRLPSRGAIQTLVRRNGLRHLFPLTCDVSPLACKLPEVVRVEVGCMAGNADCSRQAGERATAVLIGGGPSGLTAALELLRHTSIRPIVIEADAQVGGLCRTIQYKGNRMDLGGHRFFSKSDRVLAWWLEQMPLDKQQDPSQTGDGCVNDATA